MPKDDAARHFQRGIIAYSPKNIKASGHFVGANRLKPRCHRAQPSRVRNGKTLVRGPFAETKEQLGGYYLIEARNLDEAIEVASKIPGAQRRCVEIPRDSPRTQPDHRLKLDEPVDPHTSAGNPRRNSASDDDDPLSFSCAMSISKTQSTTR